MRSLFSRHCRVKSDRAFARRILTALFGMGSRRKKMENPVFDELEAVARNHQANRNARVAAEVAAFRAQYDHCAPAVRATLIKKRTYRSRQAREGLGPPLKTNEELLLRVLSFLNDLGVFSVTVPELANRVGCDPRTIQRALKRLEEIGYVGRRLQPTSNPRRHRPSLIAVLDPGWLRLNRVGPAPSGSGVGVTKMSPPSEIIKNNSSTKVERSAGKPSHSGARATPSAAARPAPDQPGPSPVQPDLGTAGKERASGSSENIGHPSAADGSANADSPPESAKELELARKAAAILHPSRAPILDRMDPFDVLDAVRRLHLSNFNADAMARAIDAHGRPTVLLAVGLALLRRKDGRGAPIRSAASYLGGMLRQSPGQLNPVASLDAILASSATCI